jgi:hypothetical protein
MDEKNEQGKTNFVNSIDLIPSERIQKYSLES